MKRRFFQKTCLYTALAVLVFPVITGLVALIAPATVAAAGPEAAFTSSRDSADISAIEKLISDHDSGPAFKKSQVIVRGGIWGDGTSFSYVRSVDRHLSHYGIQYSTDYYCVNGKPQLDPGDSDEGNIKIEASIYARPTDHYHNDATIDFVAHISHITFTPKQQAGQPTQPDTQVSFDPYGSDDFSNKHNIKTTEGIHPGKDHGEIDVNGKNVTAGCDITIADTSKPMPNLMSDKTSQAIKDNWKAALTAATGSADGGTGPGDGTTPGDSATAADASKIECGVDLEVFDLKWIVCPITKGMVAATTALDNFINVQMSIGSDGASSDPNQIFCNKKSTGDSRKSCQAYHEAWSTVRNLALGLMVAAGIVVLIAQALGMEILDAYTIRKVLPSFLIAALGITLSWQLMQFFVTLSNDLAYGVRFLIYQPFQGFDDAILGGGASAIGGLVGLSALTILGFMGLLSFLGTALLAVLVAVIVLILRDLIIIMAIIMAPIAIAMYILPNTKKLYKFWWESFSKALLMFALISGLIATGRVFSAVSSARSDSPIAQLAGFAAYFMPYFLIPATFKFAGGALRTVGGFAQDRGKGIFGGLRQFRSNQAKTNLATTRAGKRWRADFGQFGKADEHGNRKSLGKYFSRAAELAFDADEQIPFALGKAGTPGFKGYKAKVENYLDSESAAQTQKVAQDMEAKAGLNKQGYRGLLGSYRSLGEDTKAGLAKAGYITNALDRNGNYIGIQANSHMIAPNSRAQFQEVAGIMENSSKADDRIGALGIKNVAGMLPTINSDPETMRANIQGAALIGLAARGYAEDEDIALAGNRMASQKGIDYAQRVVGIAEKTGQQYHPEAKFGHSTTIQNGQFVASSTDLDRSKDTISSIKNQDWGQAKADAVKARKEVINDLATETEQDSVTGARVLTARAKGMQQTIMSQASRYGNGEPDAKAVWTELIDSTGLRPAFDEYERTYDPNRGDQPRPPEPPPDPQ